MSALVIDRFGNASDCLQMIDSPAGRCRDGDVRVRMLASPINPADLNWMEGTYGKRPDLPATPGTEAVGEVIESCSAHFSPGQKVIFLGYAHGWQQQRVVSAAELLEVPDDVAIADLAMLKVNPATAWRMLHDFTLLKPGDIVLQNAANSGVGRCVIQIARSLGLRTINFLRRENLHEELKSLGADLVCSDDDEGKQWAAAYLEQEGKKAALALNAVGGDSALRQLELLDDGATQVTYGAMARRPLKIPNQFLIFRDISIRGFWLSRWLAQATRPETAGMYQNLIDFIREEKLRQPVDRTYALRDFAHAIERVHAADRDGKVLFLPQD